MAKTTKKKNKISMFDVVNLIAMILVGLIMLMPILNLVAKAFSSAFGRLGSRPVP